MKLSKLYCNQPGFKNIRFNPSGLNIIYADVVTRTEDKKNSHDLGKTKLAELIDFLFLKGIDAKRNFLFKLKDADDKSIFNDYVFYLELHLNSGKYLTIRRNIKENTRIYFSITETSTDDFNPPENWTYENLPFQKAKQTLAELLALDFFFNKNYDYRKAISYSVRQQDDYLDVYKLTKYRGGLDIDWKPFMFDLLGFEGNLLAEKYNNDVAREKVKTLIDDLKREYAVKPEERDDIVAQIGLIENDSKEIEGQIDRFNFYEQDKELINNGIEEIETTISDLNSLSYNLNFDIDRLRKSITNNFAFDLNKVSKVYQETGIYFPDQLKNDYEALINFNQELTIERNKLLRTALKSKEEELSNINKDLQELNHKKEQMMSFLTDTDLFKKFKYYQKELVKVEGKLLKLREKLSTIDNILTKESEIERLHKEIEATITGIKNIYKHTEDNAKYKDIRAKFSSYYKRIMDEDVIISWKINGNDNVDFMPPTVQTKGEVKKDTAKDDGRTYKKILCVAFDLAILCSYNKESYFRFVYHDDVLSQQDNGIKTRLIELVRDLTQAYDFQYILSVIKSDLPVDGDQMPIYFSDEEIVLKLHDNDASGTLFGFEF